MSGEHDDDLAALLRKLASSDPFDREEAVAHLCKMSTAALVELSEHPVDDVRVGVARAIAGRPDAEVQRVVSTLSKDRASEVREALAREIASRPEWPVADEVLERLARDDDEDVGVPIVPRLAAHPRFQRLLVELVHSNDVEWEVRRTAIREISGCADRSYALRCLTELTGSLANDFLGRDCGRAAESLLGSFGEVPSDALPGGDELRRALRVIGQWEDLDVPRLRRLLESRAPLVPDVDALGHYGKLLTPEAQRGALPRAFHAADTLAAVERVLDGSGSRSVVLLGPTGAGKTAVVHELVHRLSVRKDRPWHVLRVTPSEMLVGTKYLGEWQTKVNSLVNLIASPQRVLLYIPHISELSEVGTTSHSDQMSVATLLAPDIESGRIAVIGESTPEAWSEGMGSEANLQKLFARIDVAPLTRTATREVLELVAVEASAEVEPEALDVALDVADVYLSDIELPGRAVGLLRRMLAERERDVYRRADVLQTLQDATGVPPDFLDDAMPLRVDLLRDFFEARVMGQPQALERVIDLVTLIKAGLDDPNKPSGVLLFVGPTGVGKTELSRALSELLFGDPKRLLRFDMSEYASYESYERLIGTTKREGTLTEAVRRNPFSVVLFDEIEKSHLNVFDLCLQIFDAGRLTDGKGRTVSFRKTIVVMTSNLGAKVETDAAIGFDGEAPPPPSAADIEREVRKFFRPEFLGRVDRIVQFHPLSTETADRIARREVEKVLSRGGLVRRKVSVDVDPSVYALLLRRGYSAALGARPLKQAVESLLLMPIARILATGDARPGSCIQLLAAGETIEAKLVPPDEDERGTGPAEPVTPELERLRERVTLLRSGAESIDARRTELIDRSNSPDFWDDPAGARATLDALHRLDRLLEELDRLDRDVETTANNPNARSAAQFLRRHDLDVRRLEILYDADELGDAYVRITGVRSADGGLEGVERLARMYTAWARRRRMESRVLDDRSASHESEDTITLALEGTGAFALLRSETGLHKFRRDRAGERSTTELVRVEVLPVLDDPPALSRSELRVDARPLRDAAGRLVTTLRTEVHLLHRPTMTTLRALSPEDESAAVDSSIGLLAALITAIPKGDLDVIRRYGFGPASVIRDRRTGRATGRVDRVLGGELDLVADV
ncbi:MAG: AAA family ATPase [Planctomycetota bacterium]